MTILVGIHDLPEPGSEEDQGEGDGTRRAEAKQAREESVRAEVEQVGETAAQAEAEEAAEQAIPTWTSYVDRTSSKGMEPGSS